LSRSGHVGESQEFNEPIFLVMYSPAVSVP